MSEHNLNKILPKAQHRQYYQEFKLNWHKRKHQFAKLHTNSKFGQKKKMPSDDYDPVHQLDSNSETIFLEKGSGISNDPIISFCKITDLVYHFAKEIKCKYLPLFIQYNPLQ